MLRSWRSYHHFARIEFARVADRVNAVAQNLESSNHYPKEGNVMIELLAGPTGPLLIFLLRVIDVSMGTMRFLLLTRGQRLPASLLGFVEILIWITAAGAAIRNLTSPLHVIGYAGGFGAGTYLGMWLEERLALGTITVQAFCGNEGSTVADSLRAKGLGVTEVEGEGLKGPVGIVSTTVGRQLIPGVLQTIEREDPDAFITLYDARVRRGWIPPARRK